MSINNFSAIQVGLASPERIREWSHGEVKKPETINYRSLKPERDGLFCEKIFGPVKDWECHCGKYKKVRYKGVVCDRCGVEVTKATVRRERMGHIELAAPVAHIWYLRGIPSRMGLLLDVSPKHLEEVVYFVSWIVTDPGNTGLELKQILSEKEYRENVMKYGSGSFKAGTGAEAIRTLLQNTDLEKELEIVQKELEDAQGTKRVKLIKRLETIEAFRQSKNKPEWMILEALPVIPPDLRPMLQLDGGRFATSDLNDLYRRVITRNNRLKKLLELGTPAIIVQNEKRMLQEAVDALIDNGRRSKPITGAGGRTLKSLSHTLKGKQGRFRQNLLGKRVDYSGRSVIAVGPDLKMYQCGIPREMALQLFKPFVVNELVNQKIANNIKSAEKLIERVDPRVWDVVEKVIYKHPVLLNRAPTLHRLGIQAFEPKLVEGRAIRLHPLVTPAFNADFDGDQMAVHVPLSELARAEATTLMLGSKNILGPKDGKPIVTPSQDMVLGNYYLTMEESAQDMLENSERARSKGDKASAEKWYRYSQNEGNVYRNVNEAIAAYNDKQVHLHSRVAILARVLNNETFTEEQNDGYLITSVGKLIFNEMLPKDFPFLNQVNKKSFVATPDIFFVKKGTNIREYIKELPLNKPFTKKDLGLIIAEILKRYDTLTTSQILDEIKNAGFKYSTISGTTVSIADINVAPNKEEHIAKGKLEAEKIRRFYERGHLTVSERSKRIGKLWEDVKTVIGNELMESFDRKNPISMMADSGARGNKSNFTQLAGMRGIMAKPTQSKGKDSDQSGIIEIPIYSSFREGLKVSEFFISTHGARKGLTDTALKTAESGYLTRRLVDVAQDVIVREDDCGTDEIYWVEAIMDQKANQPIESLYDRLVGRYTQDDVIHPETGEVIVPIDTMIDEVSAAKIVDAGIERVAIRNGFTCNSKNGICRKCYGRNMATGELVEVGESVGIMAAQSIGEPGTQLTMRTFHTGGVAGGDDITQGLPRVEELFEARKPKSVAVLAKIDGVISSITERENHIGFDIIIKNDTDADGIVHKIEGGQQIRNWIKVGYEVKAGEKLTEGQIAPKELLEVAGVEAVQNYILKEVQRVYGAQGIGISDKHIEVMIKQMLRKVIIVDGGDTNYSMGMSAHINEITRVNQKALLEGKTPATIVPTLLGISKSSIETESFLSAASFQETTKVLTDAAIKGRIDGLAGLKENVIIGKLIPAGTGVDEYRSTKEEVELMAQQMIDKRHEKAAQLDEKIKEELQNEDISGYTNVTSYDPNENLTTFEE